MGFETSAAILDGKHLELEVERGEGEAGEKSMVGEERMRRGREGAL